MPRKKEVNLASLFLFSQNKDRFLELIPPDLIPKTEEVERKDGNRQKVTVTGAVCRISYSHAASGRSNKGAGCDNPLQCKQYAVK